ncbi:MAG: RagB/SusD family nutrient uptake outer membrane protein [Mediterranea sp.]|jgi:hypothetical protein|nr:RagB/SusD family nutrient uptake outer membrane protein [Mediterranea sp.]
MKAINILKNILLGAVACMAATACDDSFLDRSPSAGLNNADYWKAEADLKAYTNGIYNYVGQKYNYAPYFSGNATTSYSKSNSFFCFEAASDNLASTDANLKTWADLGAGKEGIDASKCFYGHWNWEILYQCNYFLANYNRATGVAQARRDWYAGEAYFWRAWFYFDKVKEYGRVPLVTAPLDVDSKVLFSRQDSREKVMAQVLSDIDSAAICLPTREEWIAANGANKDRLNKYTAYTLKARICLYEGTWRKYHKDDNLDDANATADVDTWLTAAADAAQKVMDSGKYRVYNTGNPASDYRALFTNTNLSDNANPEVILPRLYVDDNTNGGHSFSANLYGGTQLYASPTQDFVEDFLWSDGQPTALTTLPHDDANVEDIFKNRDARLSQTIMNPTADNAKAMFDISAPEKSFPRLDGMGTPRSLTGYYYIKNFNPAEKSKQGASEITDFPILRYAEVLLSYAEAKAELNTLTQEDLDKSINLLRDRAGVAHLDITNVPVDPKYTGTGIDPLLVEIRRERRIELSFESTRYDDLMRWKQGNRLTKQVLGMRVVPSDFEAGGRYEKAKVKFYQDPVTGRSYIDAYAGNELKNRTFDENKNYLHPIGTGTIATSLDNLLQTPGWSL